MLEPFPPLFGEPSFIRGSPGQCLGKSGMTSSTLPNRKAKRISIAIGYAWCSLTTDSNRFMCSMSMRAHDETADKAERDKR